MIRAIAALAATAALSSCDGENTTGGTAPPAAKNYTCETGHDCRISCIRPGDCCGQGCDCTGAYHKDELSAVREANKKKCDGKQIDCPHYSCPKPTVDTIGACESGKCVAKKIENVCQTDDDCVVSCVQENNHCPQVCSCSNVYHKDVLAALEARKQPAAAKECRSPKCSRPTHRTVARCRGGSCQGERVPIK